MLISEKLEQLSVAMVAHGKYGPVARSRQILLVRSALVKMSV